jgi:hypothetical protein
MSAPGLKVKSGSGGGLGALLEVFFIIVVLEIGGWFSVSVSAVPGLKENAGRLAVGFRECLLV